MMSFPGTKGQPVVVRVRLDNGTGVVPAVMTLMHPDGRVIVSGWTGPDGVGELTIPAWDGQRDYHLAVTAGHGRIVDAVQILDARHLDWAISGGLMGEM